MTTERLAPFLAAAAFALAGCGGDDGGGGDENKLQTADIQERLTAELEEDTGGTASRTEPLEITSLECPEEGEKKKGTEFEGDVEAAGDLTGTVVVELDDDEGKGLTYEAELEGPSRSVGKSGSVQPDEP